MLQLKDVRLLTDTLRERERENEIQKDFTKKLNMFNLIKNINFIKLKSILNN